MTEPQLTEPHLIEPQMTEPQMTEPRSAEQGSTDSVSPSLGRKLGRSAVGLVLGLALPTGFLAWVLGVDAIKERINGRLWCSGADSVDLVVKVTSSGSSSRFHDTLVCRTGGVVTTTIGDARMTATIIGVAFAVSVLAVALLVVAVRVYAGARRRLR